MRFMTLCIYQWDILYAIATDTETIVMVQGLWFSTKIRAFTPTISPSPLRCGGTIVQWCMCGRGTGGQCGRIRRWCGWCGRGTGAAGSGEVHQGGVGIFFIIFRKWHHQRFQKRHHRGLPSSPPLVRQRFWNQRWWRSGAGGGNCFCSSGRKLWVQHNFKKL